MKLKKIKQVHYKYGDEERIKNILNHSKEPILIKIENFTDQFSIDYFKQIYNSTTIKAAYDVFENYRFVSHHVDNFSTILSKIEDNKPYRVFGKFLSPHDSAAIERYVPLWQSIPLRPRYFNKSTKVSYYFGGKGGVTDLHFDREHCCNLHLCLSGKKQLLLFTEDQSDNLYKIPYVGDALIDFSQPMEVLKKQYPRIKKVIGYKANLERGDMLFMPRNCWHYTRYLDASVSATYTFYPKKFWQFYGYFTGYFFGGYRAPGGFGISDWPSFKYFSQAYAFATGKKKISYKIIEFISYMVLLPLISISSIISYKRRKRSYF